MVRTEVKGLCMCGKSHAKEIDVTLMPPLTGARLLADDHA